MHELGIAQALVDLAARAACEVRSGRVIAVRIRVGPLSGVEVDSLRSVFPMAAAGTLCENARLEIQCEPLRVHCPHCKAPRELPDITPIQCPNCGTPTPILLSGRELHLESIEVEDDVPADR